MKVIYPILALLVLVPILLLAQGNEDRSTMPESEMEQSMEAPVPPPGSPDYKKPSKSELKQQLTLTQYRVTQDDGTEPSFNNEFWDNKEPGIYVDIVSGEPLFSSTHKYKSGTGWPSFYQPLEPGNIEEERDTTFGMVRVEVRSYYGDSHLGHLFTDGPEPTGLRYCINSASLRFVPVSEMEEQGYDDYLYLFE